MSKAMRFSDERQRNIDGTKRMGATRRQSGRRTAGAAFTLVELLIVIALSALLLALLFGPIVQGFKLTRRAQAQAAAQDATRFGIEQLARELRQASFVFDNTNTPITLPLEAPDDPVNGTKATANVTRKNTYQVAGANSVVVPLEAFGRIDFVSSAIRTDSGTGTASNDPIDPTTGRPVSGGQLRLTTAPGTRYTRYWIGLRRNYVKNGTAINKAYYDNVYEFPRTDSDLNPFVLWRADYDPTDPNLIAQKRDTVTGLTVPDTGSTLDGGGINDPDFFYNTNTASTTNGAGTATGNGRTYAENWRSIATAVIAGTNTDLLSWRRNSHRDIETRSPIQIGITFTPSAVVGDNATPGYITQTAAEDPGAIPSLYTAQYGQWTFPFTLTVYRSSTHYTGTGNVDSRGLYGNVSLQFHVDPNTGNLVVDVTSSAGTLGLGNSDKYYWMRSPSTGKIFVSMPNLTLMVDPSRGRIETGLPPLASNTPTGGGAPLFYNANAATPGAIEAMAPSVVGTSAGNSGELVETFFTESTLHRQAGQASGSQYVPKNQGILFADLAALTTQTVNSDGSLDRGNYYALTDTNHTTPYVSPFLTFGGAVDMNTTLSDSRGAHIVLGSERVTGPDNQVFEVVAGRAATTTDPNLDPGAVNANTEITGDVAYTRVPNALESLSKDANIVTSLATGVEGVFARRGPVTYQLIQDLKDFNRPYLRFDDAGGHFNDPRVQDNSDDPTNPGMSAASLIALGPNDAGLPAGFSTDTTTAHDRKIRVTYLWQNNYARTTDGRPVDASGQSEDTQNTTGTISQSAIHPEPDAMKIDYATRGLLNIALAVRVYDVSTGQPETSQVTDKVRVSNVSR